MIRRLSLTIPLVHCLSDSIESESIVFEHLKALMSLNAIFFSSTLLQDGIQQNWFKRLMKATTRKASSRINRIALKFSAIAQSAV